jgi:hypothetical protein
MAAATKASPKVSKRSWYYRGINAILSKRPPPVPVKELILSWNERIGDAGMDHLHLLPESVSTCSLGFTRCGITANGIKTLCGFAETRETVNDISLVFNPFGDEGLIHIADMLRMNTSVRYILLGVGEPDGICLFNITSLAINKTFGFLRFMGQQATTDEMVQAFCQGLEKNRFLTSWLSSNLGWTRILQCLRNNLYLKAFVPFELIKEKDPRIKINVKVHTSWRSVISIEGISETQTRPCQIGWNASLGIPRPRARRLFLFLSSKYSNPKLCMHSRVTNS